MRLKSKFAIAIIILLLIVTAGTSVYATEFKSRILSNRNISLGDGTGSSDYTIGTPNKTTIAKGYTFKERNKGSIILHSDKIIKSEGLYCIQPDVKMGYETHYSIDKDDPSEHKYTNDLGAYILTESDSNTQGYESLADSPVQQAIWTWYNYSVSTDSDLYNCAQKFDEYRKNYVEPSANTSAANGFKYGNGYAYGPLELSYVSTKWEGTNYSRSFGEITAIEGVDANGNSVSIQVLDKDKSVMDGFPESDTSIYLLATGSDALPISVKICFNEVEAEGYYQQIQGYYNKSIAEISTDIDDYCDECKKKIGSNEVDEEGYVYQVKTKKTGCGKYVNDTDSGNTGKKLKSHFSGYCGITVKNLPTRMNVSSNVESGSQSAKCGQTYSIQGYYMVESTEHMAATITRTACCGRRNTRTVEYNDYIAKVGCGKTIHTGQTYEDKTGVEREIITKCGVKYVPSTDIEWMKSQKILQRWGERNSSKGELSIEFEAGVQKIQKVDANTGNGLAGADFVIYTKEDYSNGTNNALRSWTSTTEPYEITPLLEKGSYVLVETKTPDDKYKIMDPYEFEVDETKNITGGTIVVENRCDDQWIEITKVDDKGNSVGGAKLELSNDDDPNEIYSWITKKGEWKRFYLKPGSYTLREVSAPSGYSKAEDISITVKAGENQSITMIDPREGIKIYKKEAGTNKNVSGAKMSLYTENNTLVRSWTTTNGPEVFEPGELSQGNYHLVEDEAPSGYIKGNPMDFTITSEGFVLGDAGDQVDYVVFVEAKNPIVRIIKLDEETRQPLPGAELELYDSKGNLVDAWTSTAGYKEFELDNGEYTVIETAPPEGYNFADSITFTVAGQDVEISILDPLTDDQAVVTGDLSLRKYIVDIDGNSVSKSPSIDMQPLANAITGLGGRIEEVEGVIKEGLVPTDEPKNAFKVDSITFNEQPNASNDKLGDWSHADSGEWYYYDDNGNALTGWQKIENDWYYLEDSGRMRTGWIEYAQIYYYLDSDGKMVTGFKTIGDYTYYFNDGGAMLTGWQEIGEDWYYLDSSGHMLTGWQKIDEVWYHFGSDGRMDTGWLLYKKHWYYLNKDQDSSKRKGAMLVGKYEIAPDEWYYFDPNTDDNEIRLGIMLKGWQTIDGFNYYFCIEENEFSGFKEGQMLMGRHIMSDINGVGQEDKTPYIKHIYFNKIHQYYPKGVALLTSTSTADYNHSKEPNKVHIASHVNPSSVITYKISVYNEGPDVDMRALEISDYKSNYLEFIEDDEINKRYGWTANGNVLTTTALKDVTISKCNDLSLPSSASVLLRLRVKDNVPWNYTMVNVAEISKYGDADGNDISDQKLPDIDSSAGNFPSNLKSNDGYRGNGTRGGSYVQGQEDDDDFDVVITGYPEEYIDLSLRKYITGITDKSGNAVTMTTNEGTQQVGNSRMPSINITGLPSNYGMNSSIHTATYTHKKDPIDVCAGDLVTYTITVYNEYFELDAYAVEITDYIPDGLEFVPNHPTNAIWKAEGNVIKTDALSGTLLAKYDGSTLSSASVKVVLRVKNSAYLTRFRNIAEITNYGADVFETQVTGLPHDRDSIPNNVKTQAYNPPEDNSSYQEDDDDYEELRLTMMDMGGRLWKDGNEGKTNGTDGLIDPFETGFKNHKVTLSGGESREVRTYNDAGNYFIGRVYINRDYVLTFEYEGQEYISTTQTGFGAGKSAGRENASDRSALNAKFYEVVKNTARNSNKQNTVGLRYATEELSAHNQTSTLIRDEQFNNQTLISAVTPSFSGVDAYTSGYNMNINQGAKLRTQSALALTSDVDSVDLTINGDRLKYDYSKANDMVSVTINGQPTDKLQRDDGELGDITLKEQDFERVYTQAVYESDYNFRIEDYKDYTGDKIDPTKKESRELEAYITYRLKVRNNSSKVTGTSELKIYYDNYAFEYFNKVFDPYNGKIQDIKNKNSWYVAYKSNSDGTKTVASEGSLDWENASDSSFNGYDSIKTKDESGLKNALLNPNDEIWIYIRFQIKKHDEGDIKRKITSGNRYIVGEITGYTTPEGLIDYYSQPNNIDLTNPWGSYKAEYDTTRAPGINIVSKPVNRSMSGFVFEDARTKTISANDPNMAGIVTGDGQYNTAQGDKKMNDVIVQLIEQVDIDGKHYEYIWQETTTGDPNGTVKYMDKDGTLHNDHGLDPQNDIHNDKKVRNEGNFGEGNYKFTHFVPGNYIVRFIYGDIVKNQRVVLSGQDYKYTTYNDNFADNTSNAKDNPVRRDIAMKFSKDGIDYRMSRILQNIGIETELLRQNTWINADTKNMEVRIGDIGLGHGVNFGIVERPKSNLKINKEISAVKVSNKGIIIIDTENGKGKPIQAPFKETFQEIDDELINGANLEVKYKITVSNEGELDTLYNYFEGNSAYGSNQGKHITTSAELVYDYPEKIGFDPGSNTNWDAENINLDIVWDQVKSNIEARLKAGTGLVVKSENKELSKNLIPVSSNQSGDKTVSTEIILKRVLALGQIDGFLFNNMTEIIRAKNEVGRKDAINTYGNYIPFNNDINKPNDPAPETDASYAQALVTSNAGLPYNPHYEIWLISAVMLAVGIILIKIFVIPRNKKNKEK